MGALIVGAALAVVLAVSGPAQADLKDGLVSFYNFEVAGDLGLDMMGNHPGVVMGPTPADGDQQAGKVGMAMNFEQTDGNYVDLADGFADFTTGITVAAWVNFESYSNWSRIVDIGNGAGVDNFLIANRGTSDDVRWEVHDGIAPGAGPKDANDLFD
ncbi:MAG: hypothetical protein AMS14_06485, partial [Planctomycetes bacterium DG_20]